MDTNSVEMLILLMADCSEYMWCAQWLADLEYHLWSYLETGDGRFFGGDRNNLKRLSDEIDGWAIWDKDKGCPVYIKMTDWLPIYSAWKIAR